MTAFMISRRQSLRGLPVRASDGRKISSLQRLKFYFSNTLLYDLFSDFSGVMGIDDKNRLKL
jgi:hypothetical protein